MALCVDLILSVRDARIFDREDSIGDSLDLPVGR